VRLINVTKPYSGHGIEVEPGIRYAVEDTTLAHLLNQGIVSYGITTLHEIEEGPAEKVLVSRAGGFGDLLFATPTLRALLASGKQVSVCCLEKYRDAVSGENVEWIPYPMPYERLMDFGRLIKLEGVLEFAEDPSRHAVDLIAERADVELTEGKELTFAVSRGSRAWAEITFPRRPDGPKRIGIQTLASVPTRTYPHELMVQTIHMLLLDGWEVGLLGTPGSIGRPQNPHPRMLYVCEEAKSFDQSAAFVETCDVVLAPDSAIAHLAGALRKPTVALYAAFPWQARTAYAPTVRALTGNLPCSPCFWHGRNTIFPPHGPCHRSRKCDALGQISPERIVREIDKMTPKGL